MESRGLLQGSPEGYLGSAILHSVSLAVLLDLAFSFQLGEGGCRLAPTLGCQAKGLTQRPALCRAGNADLVVSPAVHGGLGTPGLAGGSLAPAAVWVLSQTLCHWLIWFSCWLISPSFLVIFVFLGLIGVEGWFGDGRHGRGTSEGHQVVTTLCPVTASTSSRTHLVSAGHGIAPETHLPWRSQASCAHSLLRRERLFS